MRRTRQTHVILQKSIAMFLEVGSLMLNGKLKGCKEWHCTIIS